MATPTTRPRTPIRPRGHATRERLLGAAERLLATKRLEDLTVQEIVTAAGASVGSFYHLFGSRDGIVAPLYARYDARVSRGAERTLDPERWQGRSLAYRATRLVRYAVRLYRNQSGLIRALALHARAHDSSVTGEQASHREGLYARAATLLLACREEITHADPARAVDVGLFFVAASCRDKILFPDAPHPRALHVDDRSLADELGRALLAYLRPPPGGTNP